MGLFLLQEFYEKIRAEFQNRSGWKKGETGHSLHPNLLSIKFSHIRDSVVE